MTIDDFLVSPNITILEAMEVINKNAKGIVFISNANRLVGTVTDGDIRRYILKKGDLSDRVMKITNCNTVWLGIETEQQATQIMSRNSISAVPILNCNKEIVRIYFADGEMVGNEEKNAILNVPLVIMAGGKGTRLKPFTDILPKPLIPIGDKTITEYIIDKFSCYGCSDVYMIVNYKKDFIKAYFQDSNYKDIIKFIDEINFLGTGGGLKLLEGQLNKSFFMSNCDILIEADYKKILEYHNENHNLITLVCAKKEFKIPYGTVNIDETNSIIGLAEKPSYSYLVNTGFYVIQPEILKIIPMDTFIHITEIIENCIKEKIKVGAYIIEEDDWMDMGQFDEMEKMKQKLGV